VLLVCDQNINHFFSLVDMFSPSSSTREWPQSQPQAKASLIKYAGFLHYTGINHSSLAALYPTTPKSAPVSLPSTKTAFFVFLTQLFTTLLHPRAILFLPPLLAHIPAYLLGRLSVRLLATRGEEEGVAQFKAVFGGLGMGLSYTGISLGLLTWLSRLTEGTLGLRSPGVPRISQDTLQKSSDIASTIDKIGQLSLSVGSGLANVLKWVLCVVGLAYGTGSVLSRWHNALVVGEYW
jgi:glycerol-3-phosphate O-acyltransferase/dihydroxyacetone phosphate acyltransferase